MKFASVVLAAGFVSVSSLLASAEVYLQEKFPEITLDKRWISSKHNSDLGEFKVSHGKFFADEKESLGLQTSQDARFYAISAKLDKNIDNADKNLVVQFSVKNEQNIDCGGGYVKLLPPEFNQEDFRGESLYNIMFGPDICGIKRKVHVIFHHAGENKEIKKAISAPVDQLTHLYTLIVRPDQTYSVLIDNKEEESGKLEDDFDFPPAEIEDPDSKKPEDWVDETKIPDPTDVKPDDWVDGPALIPDPDAEKPEDWDDEMDGDWEAPQVPNPEYKGEWKPRQIDNPAYKGVWKAPMIPNPDYKEDPRLHAYNSSYIGFDLWQVKSGTIFDNILITDDIEYAEKFANETFEAWREAEREAKRELDKSEEKITDPEYDEDEEEEIVEVQTQEEPEKPKVHKIVDLPVVDEGEVNVEEKPSDTPVVDESEANEDEVDVEEIPSETTSTTLSSSSTPESLAKKEEKPTTTKTPVSATQEYEDEFDQIFADFEEEFGPDHKRDEL